MIAAFIVGWVLSWALDFFHAGVDVRILGWVIFAVWCVDRTYRPAIARLNARIEQLENN